MKDINKLIELAKNIDIKSNYSINLSENQKLLLTPSNVGMKVTLQSTDVKDSSKSTTKNIKTLHKSDIAVLLRYIIETDFSDELDIDDLVDEVKSRVEMARKYLPKRYKHVVPSFNSIDYWLFSKDNFDLRSSGETYNELLDAIKKEYNTDLFGNQDDPYENYFAYSMLMSYDMGRKLIGSIPGSQNNILKFIKEHQSELQYENHWIGKFIPSSGVAKTMAAELISNCHYVLYRWFNDGDSALSYQDPNMIPAINILAYIDYKLNLIDKLDFYIELIKFSKDMYPYITNKADINLSELRDNYIKGVGDKDYLIDRLKSVELSHCVEDPIQSISSVLVTLFRILNYKPEFLIGYDVINLRDDNACEIIYNNY